MRFIKKCKRIIELENDGVHTVTAAGSPILIGWVNSDGLPYILTAFVLVLAGITLVLTFAFRSIVGVLPPLCVGIMASLWAFGMQRLIEGDVLTSSAALLAPFIILAVAASHSVLFIKRLLTDEMRDNRSVLEGLHQTLIHMMRPLIVVLITDLMAFVVLSFVPFDNVRILGQVTALGLIAIIVIIPTFMVALLALMPAKSMQKAVARAEEGRASSKGFVYRITAIVVRPLIYNRSTQWAVLAIAGIMVAVSLSIWVSIPLGGDTAIGRFLADEIHTGQNNTYAVHNYLTKSWEDNALYQMEQEITRRFGGVYTLTMLATGAEQGDIKTPEALVAMDELAQHLAEAEAVSAVVGLPFYIKIMNRFLNEDQDKFFAIPTNDTIELQGRAQMAVNEALYFLTSGTPGAFDFVVDPFFQNTVLTAYVRDTSPQTVAKLIDRTNNYLDANWDTEKLKVELRMPAGNVGIAGAFNDSIKKWMVLATLFSALASYVAAALMLRSVTGPLLLMFPLAAGILVWMLLIHLIGIEFNSNVTAALAIASGVGIDAEVYLLFRFREEYPKDRDFHRALFDAFTLVREPLIFSFTALFAGCLAVSVVPLYVGYVGFSMALILLVTFMLSFFAAPVVWSMMQPRFLTRGLDRGDQTSPPDEGLETSDAKLARGSARECVVWDLEYLVVASKLTRGELMNKSSRRSTVAVLVAAVIIMLVWSAGTSARMEFGNLEISGEVFILAEGQWNSGKGDGPSEFSLNPGVPGLFSDPSQIGPPPSNGTPNRDRFNHLTAFRTEVLIEAVYRGIPHVTPVLKIASLLRRNVRY